MAINRNLVNWSRTVHIYLSIALLVILVFFSVTGITLNHPEATTAAPRTTMHTVTELPDFPLNENGQIADSPRLARFIREEFDIRRSLATLRYDDPFLIVDYQAPGKTAFVEIDREFGEAYGETTDFGLVAALNDLHKGRYTDVLWNILIDISAVLLVVFSIAGFILLLPNRYRLKRVTKYTAYAAAILTAGYYIGTL